MERPYISPALKTQYDTDAAEVERLCKVGQVPCAHALVVGRVLAARETGEQIEAALYWKLWNWLKCEWPVDEESETWTR